MLLERSPQLTRWAGLTSIHEQPEDDFAPPTQTDQKRSAILTPSACASFSILSIEMFRAPRSTWARKDLSKALRAASSSCDQPRSARRRRKLDASCCLAEIDGELGAETDIRAILGFGCFSVSSF